MHKILVKLAEFMTKPSGDVKKHVQECIGCAVIVMKPEKVHEFLPIPLIPMNLLYTNTCILSGKKGIRFLSGEELFEDWGMNTVKKMQGKMKAMLPWLEEFLKPFNPVFFQLSPGNLLLCKDEGIPSNKYALILELASLFVGATGVDSDDLIYNSIEECLKEGVEDGMHMRHFTKSWWNLPTSDLQSLSKLWIYYLIFHVGKNIYGIRMLYEIIVRPQDKKSKKVAGEILVETSTILEKQSSPSKPGNYQVFISMIMLLLFWSPYHVKAPSHVKADAVSALSLLVSDDPQICLLMPDVVPSILGLLDKEDNIQVVKVVKYLYDFHADILGGILPWWYVSQHDIKSKVTMILEIMMKKCGPTSLKSPVLEQYQDFVMNDFGVTDFGEYDTESFMHLPPLEEDKKTEVENSWEKAIFHNVCVYTVSDIEILYDLNHFIHV
ncbi:unnamed protein product [Lactuca virosa]|uniref:Uncharacterized protein n=1 Tax=Lactuca virosa TaxID=75947 RepID=A0AAU9PAP6_9ASTR|nr:unnamed protein product [Lactuca virosa]